MKGVVLWPKPDRHPLAGATNTNEAALIQRCGKVSSASVPAAWRSGRNPYREGGNQRPATFRAAGIVQSFGCRT